MANLAASSLSCVARLVRPALLALQLRYQAQDSFYRPAVSSDACLHRWRDLQRLVNPRKVVVHEVQADRKRLAAAS